MACITACTFNHIQLGRTCVLYITLITCRLQANTMIILQASYSTGHHAIGGS